jgi:hypothetical protein
MEMAVESMDMAVESMEMAPRAIPHPAGCRNIDFCPPKLVFDGNGVAELFMDGYRTI